MPENRQSDSTVSFDPNKIRDDVQDMLIDAYGELNVTCYRKATDILTEAIQKLTVVISWEDSRNV